MLQKEAIHILKSTNKTRKADIGWIFQFSASHSRYASKQFTLPGKSRYGDSGKGDKIRPCRSIKFNSNRCSVPPVPPF